MTEMKKNILLSVVIPLFNEEERIIETLESLYFQYDHDGLIDRDTYEIIIVDNNSNDKSLARIHAFQHKFPDCNLHCIFEPVQGVSSARKKGMDWAVERSHLRDKNNHAERKFYIFSADADCALDRLWLHNLYTQMHDNNADLGTSNYYYDENHFHDRPNLWKQIEKTLRCRAFTFTLFGGFPDGKGFGVEREKYTAVGGIEIFYQIKNERFVQHLSDDWDFGIKVLAYGGHNIYAHNSKVEINSRRLDFLSDDVINGIAYGSHGIIVMKDVRNTVHTNMTGDLNDEQCALAWDYSIKDFIPKNIILPLLLKNEIYSDDKVITFFTKELLGKIVNRIEIIKTEQGIVNFKPIHHYKTSSYRLYFEFRDEIFAQMRAFIGEDIGYPPILPACLDEIRRTRPDAFEKYVYFYCEDRESGNAHNYFANGGVF